MSWESLVIAIATLVVAPLVGGILFGLDRKVTARLQNRMGPPVEQPFYDVIKLFSKSRIVANKTQLVYVYVYLASVVLSLLLLVLGQDLLMLAFVLALGSVSLILGGFSVKSPYSQLGSQREVLQLLAYEPLLLLVVIGIYIKTGSFMASSVFKVGEPLLFSLPLFLVALLVVMSIKLRKSPFDISTSHHAHQEVVRGILTEYSGPYLGIIEVTHWYELILLLGLVALFWAPNLIIGGILGLFCFFLVTLVDNIAARMTWSWMLRFAWTFGVGLAVINLAALYVLA
ncbi:MAG: NADH-quinone oxidoreductase subunit H [Chloroflexota bacterium]